MSMTVSGGATKTANFFAKIEAKASTNHNLAARLKEPIVFMLLVRQPRRIPTAGEEHQE